MITELFYSHNINMNTRSLHTRSFRRIHLSVFRYRLNKLKMAFRARKVSGAFEKRAPGPGIEPRPHWSEASALTTAPTTAQPCSPYLLHNILDFIVLFICLFTYLFFEQVLSSAVQCSLTEDGLLKISQQKPAVSVKPEAQCDEECDDDGSDTGSLCSDCSGNEW